MCGHHSFSPATTCRFLRFRGTTAGHATTAAAPASSALSSISTMKMFGSMSGSSSSAASKTVVLTEEEKQARREKLSAAAHDRSQTWDRKVGQKKTSGSNYAPIVDGNSPVVEVVSPETEEAIRRAKAAEAKIEKVSGLRNCARYWRCANDPVIRCLYPTCCRIWGTARSGLTCPSAAARAPVLPNQHLRKPRALLLVRRPLLRRPRLPQ
jgi:hypothetical protein